MNKKRAIVVGCGFGGVAAARELARHAATLDIVAFNRTPVLYNYPILPRLLLADVAASQIDIPLSTLLDSASVALHTQRVEAIDLPRAQLSTDNEVFAFDYLILAPGSRAIPIDQDDGFMVYYPKAARHLTRLREEIKALCSQASIAEHNHRFVVVGGGLTGIEFAAGLRIALNRLCSTHRRNPRSVTVTLLEQQQRIAPACHPRLSRRLARQLDHLHIDVETGCAVRHIAHDHLQTTSGIVPADRVLCCIGSKPDLRLSLNGFDQQNGGLPVLPTLQLADAENVFVVGDAIKSNTPAYQETKRASHAIRQGKAAARNLVRLLSAKSLKPYAHPELPALVSLGMDYAMMEYRGYCAGGVLPARLKHYLETRS